MITVVSLELRNSGTERPEVTGFDSRVPEFQINT
jgi:hypothetical protein